MPEGDAAALLFDHPIEPSRLPRRRSGALDDASAVLARDYVPKVAGTLQPYGGRFLTSGKLTALEGNVPQRFVIIGFDSVEKARAWYESPAYQPLLAIRQKAATTTLFIAEGR